MQEIADIARGGSPRPIEDYLTNDESGINWIKIGDTKPGSKYIVSAKEKIKAEGKNHSRYVHAGDFLLTNSMSFGRPYILKIDGCIHDGWLVFANIKNCLLQDYLYHALSSKYIYDSFSLVAAGSTVKNLKSDTVKQVLFPLPPINEQKRIVEEIERITEIIEKLDDDKLELSQAIIQAKSKILDLAIHGKLVPQDLSDEPASVLLEKLRADKEAKIKASELKRDKNDSYIYKSTTDNCYYQKFVDGSETDITDEIPFEIPNNWKWCLGIEIFNPMKSRKPSGDTFRYIDIETIDNKKHMVIKPKVISVSDAPSRASREVSTGDVLFSLVRPYLENIALISKENQDCIASTGFFVCKPNEVINSNYLFFLMTSNYVVQGLNQFMKGDNSPSINGDDITKWLYPLPPLAEQKRIVEKIENAFAKLDQIAEQLA